MSARTRLRDSTLRTNKPAPKKRAAKRHTRKIPKKELVALERQLTGGRDRLGALLVEMLDGMSAALEGRRKAAQAIELARRIADGEASLRQVRR